MKSRVNAPEAKKLQAEGWTYEQLGERYGVTGERVRQKIGSMRIASKCPKCKKTTSGVAKNSLCRRCNKAHDHDLCDCGRTKKVTSEKCKTCRPGAV